MVKLPNRLDSGLVVDSRDRVYSDEPLVPEDSREIELDAIEYEKT